MFGFGNKNDDIKLKLELETQVIYMDEKKETLLILLPKGIYISEFIDYKIFYISEEKCFYFNLVNKKGKEYNLKLSSKIMKDAHNKTFFVTDISINTYFNKIPVTVTKK